MRLSTGVGGSIKLEFEKDLDSRWYIVLPEYQGNRSDLEMVQGADKLCDKLSNGKNTLKVKVWRKEHKNATHVLKRMVVVYGSFYHAVDTVNDSQSVIWLCPVTKFVFGKYPKVLSLKVIS